MSNRKRLAAAIAVVLVVLLKGSTAAASEPRLICNPALDVAIATEEPERCMILPPRASFTEGLNLAQLQWRGWGSGRARFRGVSKGFHRPYLHLRVTGYVDRLRPDRCGGPLMIYTRVRLRFDGRTYTVTPQTCVGQR
ncbi:MAG TPA: hypothetical protein VD761_00725 [Solirubrobacterales bacterium]|nr:hypothetical protein [Solirubrobacterales bacterium]